MIKNSFAEESSKELRKEKTTDELNKLYELKYKI